MQLLDGEEISDTLRLSYGLPVGDEDDVQEDGQYEDAAEGGQDTIADGKDDRQRSALAVEDLDEQTESTLAASAPCTVHDTVDRLRLD